MTKKSLVTGMVTGIVTGTAAVALVGTAAAGVTSIAASTAAAGPGVELAVFGTPLPQAPAPDLESPLVQTLSVLASGGSFRGAKESYIQGGVGRVEGITADRAYQNAADKGYFPLSFAVANIDRNGGLATADVTATGANGISASQNMQFIAGPSPTGWQLSKTSALSLLTLVG